MDEQEIPWPAGLDAAVRSDFEDLVGVVLHIWRRAPLTSFRLGPTPCFFLLASDGVHQPDLEPLFASRPGSTYAEQASEVARIALAEGHRAAAFAGVVPRGPGRGIAMIDLDHESGSALGLITRFRTSVRRRVGLGPFQLRVPECAVWTALSDTLDRTSRDQDDALLAMLAVRADLSRPRRWRVFLGCDDSEGARTMAQAAREAGWKVLDLSATGRRRWEVALERSDAVVTRGAVREARMLFEELARSVPGGHYDGWEAAVGGMTD